MPSRSRARFVQAVRHLEPGLLAWRVRNPPGGPGHVADGRLTVTVVLDGSLRVRIPGGDLLRVGPGQAVLAPPGGCSGVDRNDTRATAEIMQIDVSPLRLNGSVWKLGNEARVFRLSHPERAARFSAGFGTDPLSAAGSLQLLVNWWSMEPALAPVAERLAAPASGRISRILDRMIQENPGALRIEELAQAAVWDRFTFYRQFLRETGLAPKRYMRILRLSRALDSLVTERSSSKAMAWAAGFSDPSDFFKTFRGLVWMSPQEYLREARF